MNEDRFNILPEDILNFIGITNTKDPDFYDCLLARLVSSYTKKELAYRGLSFGDFLAELQSQSLAYLGK
jgi:hypothetical protein|uniref:Uncharacterized protein n=1 Tax=Siphoviridae sp. ctaDn21 TaxID=2825563 RepID=A0A8S5UUX6_9CAUD|nr:MAG TPA: hypothetical protein [Siphoviridae sp. ctaDn21]